MVDVVQRVPSLHTRPPTPPKESKKDVGYPRNSFDIVPNQMLDTPNDSPSSSAESLADSLNRSSRRVEFSPWTNYHRPYATGKSGSKDSVRHLPPSKDCKSSRSILKLSITTDASLSGALTDPPAPDNFPAMLEIVVQQLASHPSRLNAYQTLLGCLAAHNDYPELQALRVKMPLLIQFISRDLSGDGNGTIDTRIASQALKLLMTFLWTPEIAQELPEEFCSFVLERAISNLEDPATPKMLVNHYMQLLAKQKFPTKVLGAERTQRLLTVLDLVTNNVKGNGVIAQRLTIYQRLLTQARPLMVSRAKDWIDHLFSGMLSNMKEIRVRAIMFGVDAGLILGTTNTVSQACANIFNRQPPEGKKFVEFVNSRLNTMLTEKEDGAHVPQIWSVVILFLRGRRRQIERWEHLKTWLVIIQRCFNSSDAHTKFQANIAWNRLVFAVNTDTSTPSSMVNMLRQPIVSQLDRKASDKHTKSAKHIAQSSYCNLLYYALRPAATHAQLDQFWEQYVMKVLPEVFFSNQSDIEYACQILTALFGGFQPKTWDENRANLVGLVKPEELSRLDPKWIRSNVSDILALLEKVFLADEWHVENGREAKIVQMWRSFAKALGDAGNKEVKVSTQTITVITEVLSTITRFWDIQSTRERTRSDAARNFMLVVDAAVTGIGPIPFSEKRIVRNSNEEYQVFGTPSSRTTRSQGSPESAMGHLLSLLVNFVDGAEVVENIEATIKELIHLTLRTATSRRSRLKGLRDLLRLLPKEASSPSVAGCLVWKLIAEATLQALDSTEFPELSSSGTPDFGHEYKDVVKILEVGVCQRSTGIFSAWQALKTRLALAVRLEVGDAGNIVLLINPISNVICQRQNDNGDTLTLRCAIAIMDDVSWPTKHMIGQARQRLWESGAAHQKATSFDPLEHFYSMVDLVLSSTYNISKNEASFHIVPDFISKVASIMVLCPISSKAVMLKQIQRGLAVWIKDAKVRIVQPKSGPDSLRSSFKGLWGTVVSTIDGIAHVDSKSLLAIDILLVSCMSSHHKRVLDESIKLWNRTFGRAENLEYSDDLRRALLKLSCVAELQLPDFPDQDELEEPLSPLLYSDSNIKDDEVQLEERNLLHIHYNKHLLPHIGSPILPFTLNNTPKKSLGRETPDASSRRRLRHDDSQIQFAPVNSSPPSVDVDSQMLTDRQKEIRERQRYGNASLFPDIRSSPNRVKTIFTNGEAPQLILNTDRRSQGKLDPDAETSPTFPPPGDLMSDFLGSSPTPRSNRKGSADRASLGSVPSSPRSIGPLSLMDLGPRYVLDQILDQPMDSITSTDGHLMSDREEFVDAPFNPISSSPARINNDQEKSTITSEGLPTYTSDPCNLSDQGMQIEVVKSEPTEDVSNVIQLHARGVHCVPDLGVEGTICHSPNHDDEISAQLAHDLERASSQQGHTAEQATEPSEVGTTQTDEIPLKRKRSSVSPEGIAKRVKRSPRRSIAVIIESAPRASSYKALEDTTGPPESGADHDPAHQGIASPRKHSEDQEDLEFYSMRKNYINKKQSTHKSRSDSSKQPSSQRRRSARLNQTSDHAVDSRSASPSSAKSSTPFGNPSTQNLEEPMTQPGNQSMDGTLLATNTKTTSDETLDVPEAPAVTSAQQLLQTHDNDSRMREKTTSEVQYDDTSPVPNALQRLKLWLEDVKQVKLGVEEERAIVNVLFDSVREVHEAGRRNASM